MYVNSCYLLHADLALRHGRENARTSSEAPSRAAIPSPKSRDRAHVSVPTAFQARLVDGLDNTKAPSALYPSVPPCQPTLFSLASVTRRVMLAWWESAEGTAG